MNKRQHKKTMCNLVAKVAAKVEYPELKLSPTRPEKKLLKNEFEKVKWLAEETLKNTKRRD